MHRILRFAVVALFLSWSSLSLSLGQDRSVQLLERLTNAHGPSGFEGPVREIVREEWRGLLDQMDTDGMGNVLGSSRGSSEGPRILLMAHLDETGFMVRYIDSNGFIFFNALGGYYAQSVLTQRMEIMTPNGPVIGYTGFKSGHAFHGNERNELVPIRDMFIDIGARSREEAMQKFGIRPGLPIAYYTRFVNLNGTTRYLAKAWDDRIGLAAITEVLERLRNQSHPNTVVVAATTQEEIGLRGAAVVYEGLHPDLVLNLEIGIASDFPLKTSPKEAQGRLGEGPSLFVYDNSMIPNQHLLEWIMQVAEEENIPYQFESVSGYGEDGSETQRSGTGIPSINLGVTTRYGHSQSGVIDIQDYHRLVDLLDHLVQRLNSDQVESIRRF